MFKAKKGILLLTLAMTLVLGACSKAPEASNSAGGGQQEKELRVGTYGVSIGFSIKNSANQLEGYDIAVIDAIAKKLGYTKVTWTTADMTGLFGMLDAGKIDTIANQVETSAKRKEKYAFSNTYIYSGAQLIVRKDDNSITKLSDLKGKKIGVNVGTSKETYLRENDPNKELNIVTYEDPSAIMKDVALGRLDAYIMDRAGAQLLIENSGLALKLAGDPVYTYEEAFPFVNNAQSNELREAFNKALDELAKDGTLTEISNKWLKQDISKGK